MVSRPSALDALDGAPSSLPHGTEVTTRVERLHGERRLPQGLVGRIARERDGGFDVHVVGVGDVWFRREELLPRREGQLAFAVRTLSLNDVTTREPLPAHATSAEALLAKKTLKLILRHGKHSTTPNIKHRLHEVVREPIFEGLFVGS